MHDETKEPDYLADDVITGGQVYAWMLHPNYPGLRVSEASKALARANVARNPEFAQLPQNSRSFVRRVARHIVNSGITQIIDLGSGLPTDSSTHQVAQAVDPQAKVVYVDAEEFTIDQAEEMLGGDPNVAFVHRDICEMDAILDDPQTKRLIDFDQPIGLMMASVIHLVSEEHCREVAGVSTHELVRAYLDRLPAGSMFAFEHFTSDGQNPAEIQALNDLELGVVFRPVSEIRGYFDGLDIVQPYLGDDVIDPPDVVWSNRWRHPQPEKADRTGSFIWGGLGVKR